MLRKILGTLGTKFLLTGFTFLIVILNTRFLGAEGQGSAALINLSIAIILALNNFIGGGAVVYLAPRIAPSRLALPAYAWASLLGAGAWITLSLLPFFPPEYAFTVALLGWMHSIFIFHMHLMLGKEDVKGYNLTMLLQVGFTLIALAYFFLLQSEPSIEAYLNALLIGFGLAFLFSLIKVIPLMRSSSADTLSGPLKSLWKYGSHSQLGNLIHLGNKRLSYILIETLTSAGRAGVGIYSVGAQLSEAMWMVSSSLATVQYSRIVNSQDPAFHRALSLRMLRIAILISICGTAFLILLPDALYSSVFGAEITGVRTLLLLLAPGIVSISADSIMAHHLSGQGLHRFNTYASVWGITALLASGIPLVLIFGMPGAAGATSLAYLFQTGYHWAIFRKRERATYADLIPDAADLAALKAWFK